MSPIAERHGIIRHNPMLINGCLANNSPYLKQKNCLLQEWLNPNWQGVPERMFFLEKGKPPLEEHFFGSLVTEYFQAYCCKNKNTYLWILLVKEIFDRLYC